MLCAAQTRLKHHGSCHKETVQGPSTLLQALTLSRKPREIYHPVVVEGKASWTPDHVLYVDDSLMIMCLVTCICDLLALFITIISVKKHVDELG